MSVARNLRWLKNKPDWHVQLLARKLGVQGIQDPELLRLEVANFHEIERIPVTRAEMYTERLLSYWDRKLHKRLSNPTHAAQYINSTCGDTVTMEARIENDIVVVLEFTAQGCCMSECSAAMLVEEARGKPLSWISELTFDKLYDILGVKLERKRIECVMASLNCLKKLPEGKINASP